MLQVGGDASRVRPLAGTGRRTSALASERLIVSTDVCNPVYDLLAGTGCVYLCCQRCQIEWHHEVASTRCTNCGALLEAGTLATAHRRAIVRNGL